jgi:hypothetical protein
MGSIVGFTLHRNIPLNLAKKAEEAQNRALAHFPHLEIRSLILGESRLDIWGHSDINGCLHTLKDGSQLVLVGSPVGETRLTAVEVELEKETSTASFELPWDGRVILLKISPDGCRWTMWNDWVGSIPVFHTPLGKGWIAGTLEPVVTAASNFSKEDIFLPSLLSLMIHGHYMADWTLFKSMKIVSPDSAAEWEEGSFKCKSKFSVQPSQDRFEASWDEMVDEMYALSRKAIEQIIHTQPAWLLPLSGGLDSRLIAAVGADLGADMHAFSWGAANSADVVYGEQIAQVLGLPWERIDLGQDYLVNFTPIWADLFGSAMHFHGMYQMPFYQNLTGKPMKPILTGFLGEVLAGSMIGYQVKQFSIRENKQLLPDGYLLWEVKELNKIISRNINDALDLLGEEINNGNDTVNQKTRHLFITLKNLFSRQRLFISFQSIVSDYYRGVATPFINIMYARFCLSLPRAVLDDRRLQKDMFRKYYSKLATIPGTYGNEPITPTGQYLLKKRIAKKIPHQLLLGPFKQFRSVRLYYDPDNVQKHGRKALWPIDEAWDLLGEWFDLNILMHEYNKALSGELFSIRKLQPIQAFAFRLLNL